MGTPVQATVPIPPAGGKITDNFGFGTWKRETMTERVTLAANGVFAQLAKKLPPHARVIWGAMRNASAVALDILGTDTTAAAGTGALALTLIAPTSLATGATTSHFFQGPTATANDSLLAGSPDVNCAPAQSVRENTSTSEQTIYVMPYGATTGAGGARRFDPNTTTPTSGYTFGTSGGSVDVAIVYERYFVPPA